MANEQVEKFSQMQTQVDTFKRELVVLQTKLGSLKEEYEACIKEIKSSTGIKDVAGAVVRLKQLDTELSKVNTELKEIFNEFDGHAKRMDL